MNAQAQTKLAPANLADDNAKRRQIVEGARTIFLANWFDAASMNDIARAAGVSKGTLYVYFTNKVQLFEAIVHEECFAHAERIFDLDNADHDVAAVLTRLGIMYIQFMLTPGKASAVRTVIAIAERMPEVGKVFYETGPAAGIARVAAYLRAQTETGVLAIEDCTIAAAQFLESCQATLVKPVILFNFAPAPAEGEIERVVGIAVRTLLAAYRVR
jgi:AcrR family transcriptional regulator